MENQPTIIIISRYASCRNSVANIILNKSTYNEINTIDTIFMTRSVIMDRTKLNDVVILSGNIKTLSDYFNELVPSNITIMLCVKCGGLFSEDLDIYDIIQQIIPGINTIIVGIYDNEEISEWLSKDYIKATSVLTFSKNNNYSREQFKNNINPLINLLSYKVKNVKTLLLSNTIVKIQQSETDKYIGFQKSLGSEYALLHDVFSYVHLYQVLNKNGNNGIRYGSTVCIENINTGQLLYETQQGYISTIRKIDGNNEKFWEIISVNNNNKFVQIGDEIYIKNVRWPDNYVSIGENDWLECDNKKTIWKIKIDKWMI